MTLQNNATGYWTDGDYGSTPRYNSGLKSDNYFNDKDIKILRNLAKKLSNIANQSIQSEKKKLWTKHNSLKKTRPLIICDPENGWNEIITEEQLLCTSRLAKHWEMILRKEIFWGEKICDDKPIEAKLDIGYTHIESGWGLENEFIGGHNGGSYIWISPIKDYNDINKLKFPKIEIDFETTEWTKKLAQEIFSDFLEIRIIGNWWWSNGLTYDLVLLRGMEQVMLDMISNPKFVHEIMEILKEGTLAKIDYLQSNNLLHLNNDLYLPPGGFGYTNELPQKDYKNNVRAIDLWNYSESQETIGVSPKMFEEFVFPYQLRIQEKFGLNSYGCCEPLDKRWEIIRNIPRLRKVSVSAWANLEDMANNLEDKYCYCLKPNPADLAISRLNKEKIRKELRNAFKITKNCRVEVLMQDNHTIGKNPQNVIDWVGIAKEEAENIFRK